MVQIQASRSNLIKQMNIQTTRPNAKAFLKQVDLLVEKAQHETGLYPVSQDHCFMRIIYDNVVKDKWQNVVQAPAIHNLSDEQLEDALFYAQLMYEQPFACGMLNKLSLYYRGKY